jgi:hypothetical protein
MCDCDDKNEYNNIPNSLECDCDYLKPLSIHKLFSQDDCTGYKDVLEKAKKVRNAFFAAKTSVYNFVNDCDSIADTLQSDLSDNEVELDHIRQQYLATLNNLSSSLYTSLNVIYNGKKLVNVDLSKVNLKQAQRPQKSTELRLSYENSPDPTTLTYVPGVTIQLNKDTKLLKLKLSEPEYISGSNKHGIHKREKDVTTTYVLAPSIFCIKSYENYKEDEYDIYGATAFETCNVLGTYETQAIEGLDVFQNIDIARDFFEEIQNYQDNYVIDMDSSYGNQILEIMNYFDKTISRIEGTHKYVVQLCKINN